MTITTERYLDQVVRWPAEGRHILAHCDDQTIIVYQAYSPAIADYAVRHDEFGGEFSHSRMSWIKPNFLWMMFRSGWGTKADQEATLGLRLRRSFFDTILEKAVASTFGKSDFADMKSWKAALARSEVRLQCAPDHGPNGEPLTRRAVQLGLRGETLRAFGTHELLQVIDMTAFVAKQRERLQSEGIAALDTPAERIYMPATAAISGRLGLAG
jgi:hypothetical protein